MDACGYIAVNLGTPANPFYSFVGCVSASVTHQNLTE